MISVRIGTGEGENFEVWTDADWPTVPRVGEKITYLGGRLQPQVVRAVTYLVGENDELIAAMVSV